MNLITVNPITVPRPNKNPLSMFSIFPPIARTDKDYVKGDYYCTDSDHSIAPDLADTSYFREAGNNLDYKQAERFEKNSYPIYRRLVVIGNKVPRKSHSIANNHLHTHRLSYMAAYMRKPRNSKIECLI